MIDYGFPEMAQIIPESTKPEGDGFWIQHRTFTPEQARHEKQMAAFRADWTVGSLEPGTYCILHECRNGLVWDQWMSDTWLERFTNADILEAATGDVLLAGLGIGMVAVAVCRKQEVRSVVALELHQAVIDLVEPHIRHPKLRVIKADARQPPFAGRCFDVIYLDIWKSICSDNWADMKPLLRLYRSFGKKGGIVTGWLKDYVQRLARQAAGT